MSWISTKERFQDRAATHTQGVISESRSYLVKYSAQPTGASAALLATGIPAYGDSITVGSTTCYCKNKSVKAIDGSAKEFIVSAVFESVSAENQGDEIEDPLDRPVEYSISAEEYSEPYYWDADGTFVATSAGEAFDQQPQRDQSRTVISITRNEPATGTGAFSPVAAAALSNTLNNASITICGVTYSARKLRMKPITATLMREGVYQYWSVKYTIILPSSDIVTAWDHEIADQGYIANYSGTIVDILDPRGQRWPRPYPLDGSGAAKTAFTDDPAVLTFHPYAAADWSTLGLPATLP